MIYIFCGEDIVSSRRYLIKFKQNYQETASFGESDFSFARLNELINNQSLFSDKFLIVFENLKKPLEQILKSKKTPKLDFVFWFDKKIEGVKTNPLLKVIEFKITNYLSVFKVADAFGAKRGDLAIRFLEKIWEKTEFEIIIGTLTRQIRLILLYKEGSLEKLPISPFIKEKIKEQAGRWDIKELKKAAEVLLNLDFTLKSRKMEPKLGLSLFLNTFSV